MEIFMNKGDCFTDVSNFNSIYQTVYELWWFKMLRIKHIKHTYTHMDSS